MATVYLLGIDHDASAGEASYHRSEILHTFLKGVIQGADTVYVGNDSLRQSAHSNLFNMITNLYRYPSGEVYENGNIFESVIDICSHLKRCGIDTRPVYTTTSDVFTEEKLGLHFLKEYKLLEARRTAALHALQEHPNTKGGVSHDDAGSFLARKAIPFSTHLDTSKFMSIWLKAQELSLRHPEDRIVYHFIDDKKEYGQALMRLFTKHPELLPSNVEFTFDYFDYFDESDCKHEAGKTRVQGTGIAHEDFVARIKQFPASCMKKHGERARLGQAFSGVLFAGRYESIRLALSQPSKLTKRTTADMDEAKTSAQPSSRQRVAASAPISTGVRRSSGLATNGSQSTVRLDTNSMFGKPKSQSIKAKTEPRTPHNKGGSQTVCASKLA